jgi:predicted Zn finger-like uncharacterized protein
MKIVCPTCEATYEVPESVLAAKRALRCARCGNEWVPGANWQPEPSPAAGHEPSAAAPAPPAQHIPAEPLHIDAMLHEAPVAEPPAPVLEAAPAPLPPVAARLRQTAATAFGDPIEETPADAVSATRTPVGAWIASIAFLVALAISGIVFRAQVIHAWPASERLYSAIGLAPAPNAGNQ